MYTNHKSFGGDFRQVLDSEFEKTKNVTIASGYASLDVIEAFYNPFIEIAKKGGRSRLLLGMAFYEGLGQKKLDTVNSLNEKLKSIDDHSGVFVTNGRKYHGKVYHFDNDDYCNIYVGSSNFSSSGTKGNLECTIPVKDDGQKQELIRFLNNLYSPEFSIPIHKAEIQVPGLKKAVLQTVDNYWQSLKKWDQKTMTSDYISTFEYSLERVVEKEKSNLNVYFGKGRLNSKTGKVTPRPWYEIELIANQTLTALSSYPKGDFLAYTDDGYIIPMRTQGDYYKNIRSKKSLQIFGIWLKGKLENKGVLKKYEPVTLETLEEYGNTSIKFSKFEEGKYYMSF